MFFFNKNVSQNFIGAKHFVKNNNVYLRWVPSNFYTFQHCLKEGFILKRIIWNNTATPDTSLFRNATFTKYVKAFDANDPIWKIKIEKNIETGFLYNVLFKSNTKNISEQDYFYGLAMLTCDQDTSMARASGLFYIDDENLNEKYAYLILAKNPLNKKIKPAIIVANTSAEDYLPNPDSLKTKVFKKEVSLIWPEEKYKSFYTGYFIERSEDGINFNQLNKKPHIQIKTKDDKNKTDITFIDTTGQYNIQYYYRVKGLNFFGASGNYSNMAKAKLIKPVGIKVSLDSSKVFNDSLQKIYWHLAGKINKNELVGLNIYRSVNDSGPYKKINKEIIKEATFYIDETPQTRSFYKIAAYNIYGDSTLSFSIMAMLPDVKPPAPPKNSVGKIDSNGIVKLSWSPNKEKDLKGYRIFRCNSVLEEQVEITTKVLTDTSFTDKIDLNTLTENVVYYLTSVDNVYNNSRYTSPIVLKRPDKIKPVAVIFTSLTHNDTCLNLNWINSSSKDAYKYELFQINQSGNLKKLKEWLAKDSLRKYSDSNLDYDNYYSYKIKVTDNNNNFSENISPKHFFSSRLRKAITDFKYSINTEKKTILLEWQAPSKDVFSYVLYRAKKGDEFISYKTLKQNILKFEDKDLNIGNIYLYKIKANLNSGAETILSKELNVEF